MFLSAGHVSSYKWMAFLWLSEYICIKIVQEFCYVLSDVYNHDNTEQGYKEAFRVFSKDEEGAIPAEEIK